MSGRPRPLFPKSIWDENSVMDAFDEYGIKRKHYSKFMSKLYDDFRSGKIRKLEEYELPDEVSKKCYKFTRPDPTILNDEGKLRGPEFLLMTSKVVKREDSQDGNTTKLLIELQDGQQVESVLMRYDNTLSGGRRRTTLCVSSQVGCAMACTFCATGTMGILGSLCSGEILEQFIWANEIDRIRNVVFMGMGEPLQNYDAVLSAINAMTEPARFALRKNRVTLSTVGVVNRMFQLIDTAPQITLALSLHAPTQEMREKIVPSARQYSLDSLMEAIDYYYAASKNQMLLEYVMLDDVNCGEDTAHELGKLLQGRQVMVNLIPFNPVLTKAQHVAPSVETCEKFASIVSGQYGVFTTLRKELGQDISGACGQLAVETAKKNRNDSTVETMPKDTLMDTAFDGSALEDDDVEDVVGNGLEGIVSAIGAMPSQRVFEETQTTQTTQSATATIENDGLKDLEDFVSDVPKNTKTTKATKGAKSRSRRSEALRVSVEREMDDVEDKTDSTQEAEVSIHKNPIPLEKITDIVGYSFRILQAGPINRTPDDGIRGETKATKMKTLVDNGVSKSDALDIVNQRTLNTNNQYQGQTIRRVFMPQSTKPILGPIEKHTTTVNPSLRMPKTNVVLKGKDMDVSTDIIKNTDVFETSDDETSSGLSRQRKPVASQMFALGILMSIAAFVLLLRRLY